MYKRLIVFAALLAISASAIGQEINFKSVSDGETVSLQNLQILFEVNDLPQVNSRIWLRMYSDGEWVGGASVYCQGQYEFGNFNYQASLVEMVNLRDLGDLWCVKQKNVSVVVRTLDLSSWVTSGADIEFNVEFQWWDDGWKSTTKSVFLIAE